MIRGTMLSLLLLSSAMAEEQQPMKCLVLELSQTSYSLNVWTHVRNMANAVTVMIPVDARFFDQVHVGDQILEQRFRWGSLAVRGSFGSWNLKVVEKLEACGK